MDRTILLILFKKQTENLNIRCKTCSYRH